MPRDALADGFANLCIDPGLNFYANGASITLEAQYVPNVALATPIVADVPMKVSSAQFVDTMFTAGSVAAEALKVVFGQCKVGIDVQIIPRADAAGAVKAVYTMTVTGPATSAGTLSIWLGRRKWAITIPVASGDTATAIAANIVAALPYDLPYKATVAAGVITLTAVNGGTVGNFLNPVVNWEGFANYMPGGVQVTTVRTTPGSVDPAPLNYATAMGTCCSDVFALLSGNAAQQTAMKNFIRSQWACNTPQCFGHGFTYANGTAGQVMAAGDGLTAEMSYLAYPANDTNFPWLLVANYAAARACTVADNPELSIQGPVNGLLTQCERPETCSAPWSNVDAIALKAAGFVVYGPVSGGTGTTTNAFIQNDVTNYLRDSQNRPNVTWRDVNSRFLDAATAIKIAKKLQEYNGLALYTRRTRIQPGIKGTTVNMMRADFVAWLRSQVGILFSDFDDYDSQVVFKTDFEIQNPCFGTPGLVWVYLQYKRPVRIVAVNVQAQPAMLDNCVR